MTLVRSGNYSTNSGLPSLSKEELQYQLAEYRKSMKLLLDYACGFKKTKVEQNDIRLIDTIKNIYKQIRETKKRLRRL